MPRTDTGLPYPWNMDSPHPSLGGENSPEELTFGAQQALEFRRASMFPQIVHNHPALDSYFPRSSPQSPSPRTPVGTHLALHAGLSPLGGIPELPPSGPGSADRGFTSPAARGASTQPGDYPPSPDHRVPGAACGHDPEGGAAHDDAIINPLASLTADDLAPATVILQDPTSPHHQAPTHAPPAPQGAFDQESTRAPCRGVTETECGPDASGAEPSGPVGPPGKLQRKSLVFAPPRRLSLATTSSGNSDSLGKAQIAQLRSGFPFTTRPSETQHSTAPENQYGVPFDSVKPPAITDPSQAAASTTATSAAPGAARWFSPRNDPHDPMSVAGVGDAGNDAGIPFPTPGIVRVGPLGSAEPSSPDVAVLGLPGSRPLQPYRPPVHWPLPFPKAAPDGPAAIAIPSNPAQVWGGLKPGRLGSETMTDEDALRPSEASLERMSPAWLLGESPPTEQAIAFNDANLLVHPASPQSDFSSPNPPPSFRPGRTEAMPGRPSPHQQSDSEPVHDVLRPAHPVQLQSE